MAHVRQNSEDRTISPANLQLLLENRFKTEVEQYMGLEESQMELLSKKRIICSHCNREKHVPTVLIAQNEKDYQLQVCEDCAYEYFPKIMLEAKRQHEVLLEEEGFDSQK